MPEMLNPVSCQRNMCLSGHSQSIARHTLNTVDSTHNMGKGGFKNGSNFGITGSNEELLK